MTGLKTGWKACVISRNWANPIRHCYDIMNPCCRTILPSSPSNRSLNKLRPSGRRYLAIPRAPKNSNRENKKPCRGASVCGTRLCRVKRDAGVKASHLGAGKARVRRGNNHPTRTCDWGGWHPSADKGNVCTGAPHAFIVKLCRDGSCCPHHPTGPQRKIASGPVGLTKTIPWDLMQVKIDLR